MVPLDEYGTPVAPKQEELSGNSSAQRSDNKTRLCPPSHLCAQAVFWMAAQTWAAVAKQTPGTC